MKRYITYSLLLLCLLLTSCVSMVVNALVSEEMDLVKLTNGEKEVVFFPMAHVGPSEFYDDVAAKVDSLKELDYVFLYESAGSTLTDSLESDKLSRKFRKVFGTSPSALASRADTVNQLLFNEIEYKGDLNLMTQPPYSQLNLDTSEAYRADASMEELFAAYEKQYGEIELSECDRITPLEAEYNCDWLNRKDRKAFRKEYIHAYRNQVLAETLLEVNSNKVAIIYGQAHLQGLREILEEENEEWTVVE